MTLHPTPEQAHRERLIVSEQVRRERQNMVDDLKRLGERYAALYGAREGLEIMGDDFCRIVADVQYPNGWLGMVQFLMRAAG
ncbi:MAG: hypothetical protein PHT60_15310 [Acidiphilium sp.]|nr:hypothetical protein [Acidiphilium sp.]